MWELDHKENWVPKNWCFWTLVLKTLESPVDCKEIQPVHPKGNQSWIFTGRTEAEALILWPPDAKNWLLRKDPDAWKDWRQEEKESTKNEVVGWHHDSMGMRSSNLWQLVMDREAWHAVSPWSCKGPDRTVHWTELICIYLWLICAVWQKLTQPCKAIILQLKNKIITINYLTFTNLYFPFSLSLNENNTTTQWWNKMIHVWCFAHNFSYITNFSNHFNRKLNIRAFYHMSRLIKLYV